MKEATGVTFMTFHRMTKHQRFPPCPFTLLLMMVVNVDDDGDDDGGGDDDDNCDDVDDDDNYDDQVSSLSSCPPPKLVDAALVFLPGEDDEEVRPSFLHCQIEGNQLISS